MEKMRLSTSSKFPEPPSDLVWIQTAFLGDVILNTGAFDLASRRFPGVKQHVVTTAVGASEVSSIAALPDWRKWLAEFGGVAKGADAILIPFFMYAYEDLLDDRGLIEKKRAAGVSLLLVETSTGALIWAGNQEAVATTKEFSTSSSAKELAFAPWERVMQRLLVNNIWRDFPGRQEQ